jgi:hypothetical protein
MLNGVIYMNKGKFKDQGSKYYYNTGIYGGAISLIEVTSSITQSSFYSNYANYGGSIYYEE